MSRSTKLPIVKQPNKGRHQSYWRRVKRTTKNYMRSHKYELNDLDFILNIPNPKIIVNDWDYCDYKWDYRFTFKTNSWSKPLTEKERKKLSSK